MGCETIPVFKNWSTFSKAFAGGAWKPKETTAVPSKVAHVDSSRTCRLDETDKDTVFVLGILEAANPSLVPALTTRKRRSDKRFIFKENARWTSIRAVSRGRIREEE
jgi:hypothetical protein